MEVKVDQAKIKELRISKSWSQEKLAEEAKVSLRTIQRMELDGSASLKSRLAVAEALGVKPSFLDLQPVEQADEMEYESVDPVTEQGSFLQELFEYPGNRNISNKIRTPILVFLWFCMIITGGFIPIVALTMMAVYFFGPPVQLSVIFVAQLPIFSIFILCVGLYLFFKRLFTPTSV